MKSVKYGYRQTFAIKTSANPPRFVAELETAGRPPANQAVGLVRESGGQAKPRA